MVVKTLGVLVLACLPVVAFAQDALTEQAKSPEPIPLNETPDQALPNYVPLGDKPSGTLELTCSTITEPLLKRWSQDFQAIYPDVTVNIRSTQYSFDIVRGSSSPQFGFLFESTGDASNFSDPTIPENNWPVLVAIDQLDIIVHEKNPVPKLHANQLAWIYSEQGGSWDVLGQSLARKPYRLLDHPRLDTWKQLGAHAPPLVSAPLHVYAREQTADDSDFLELQTVGVPSYLFAATIERPRHPRDDVNVVPSAAAMVEAVAEDPQAIGYVSHSVKPTGVRAVPLEGNPVDLPNIYQPEDGPHVVNLPLLARPVYLWISPSYVTPRTPAEQEFLKFILSQEGQKTVADLRFFPLPADVAAKQLPTAINTPKPRRRMTR